ncbi:MAG TPA: TIGR00725 family protein [Candidatus Binataceae bacterium]|nr:TIGR00725 family protein [Candidatus Binataceae bacterium]
MPRRVAIAVIGAGDARPDTLAFAREVGHCIAERGAVLICGGRTGVMQAAAAGAQAAGGHTIGILPNYDRGSANPHIEFVIATGMGQARNVIIVASSDAVIALPGEGGTLSEIGLALKLGRPVIALGAWREIDGIRNAATPEAAVTLAFELAMRANAHDKNDRTPR